MAEQEKGVNLCLQHYWKAKRRTAPDSRLSLANSTFYILLDVGVGIGPLILGMVQPLWGYQGLFAAMAGVAVVALAAYLAVSRKGAATRRSERR